MHEKEIVMETIFLRKNLSGKSLQSQFHQFHNENIVYLAFKFIMNKNQSGWLMTSQTA